MLDRNKWADTIKEKNEQAKSAKENVKDEN